MQPTSSATSASSRVPRILLTCLIFFIGLALSVFVAWAPPHVLPAFQEVQSGFGMDQPLLTRLVMQYHAGYWLLPVLVLLMALVRGPRQGGWFGMAGALLVFLLTAIAAYWPVIAAGTVV